jgi:hypothetical protein
VAAMKFAIIAGLVLKGLSPWLEERIRQKRSQRPMGGGRTGGADEATAADGRSLKRRTGWGVLFMSCYCRRWSGSTPLGKLCACSLHETRRLKMLSMSVVRSCISAGESLGLNLPLRPGTNLHCARV